MLSLRGLSGSSREGMAPGGVSLLLPPALPFRRLKEPGTGLDRREELGVLAALSESVARSRKVAEFVGLCPR